MDASVSSDSCSIVSSFTIGSGSSGPISRMVLACRRSRGSVPTFDFGASSQSSPSNRVAEILQENVTKCVAVIVNERFSNQRSNF